MKKFSQAIANTILDGFNHHIELFSEITQSAKQRFELCLWVEVQEAAKQRTDFYDLRVCETLKTLNENYELTTLDDMLWINVKMAYMGVLTSHEQPELAETFYNSVFCHLFSQKYYHNDYIFVESTANRLDGSPAPVIYTRYHPAEKGVFQTIKEMITSPNFNVPYVDIENDVNQLIQVFRKNAKKTNG